MQIGKIDLYLIKIKNMEFKILISILVVLFILAIYGLLKDLKNN